MTTVIVKTLVMTTVIVKTLVVKTLVVTTVIVKTLVVTTVIMMVSANKTPTLTRTSASSLSTQAAFRFLLPLKSKNNLG